jgi:hypothetical protein
VGAVAGGAAVFLATPSAPMRPELKPIDYNLVRPEDREYVVSPQKLLDVLYRYADFDLTATIDMSANTELDVVFHKIAEWDHVGDQHVPPFHTRFHVLRLSTRGEGRAFLTSEEALFDDKVAGVRVHPGSPLTLVLEARGREVRANVAGTEIPRLETRDDHGNLAFVVRGGRAVIKRLQVTPWATSPQLLPFGWGAILGCGLGAVLLLFRPQLARLLVALFALVPGGVLAWALVMHAEFLAAAEPSTLSTVVAGLCFLPLSVLIAIPGRRVSWRVVVGVLVALLPLEYAARAERDKLQAFEDQRLDLYFGPRSGNAPFDALARRLANNRHIHYPLAGMGQPARYDVVFLGGGPLFDYGDPESMAGLERNVVGQVAGHLRNELGGSRVVQTAALPTLAPHSYQQLLLLERFYLEDYRPKVVVFGVSDAEQEEALHMPARQLDEALPDADAPGWSALVDLWVRALRPQVPPGAPEDLRRTLEDLGQLCGEFDARLVLVVDKSLDAERAAVVRGFAIEKKVLLVDGFDIWATPEGVYPIAELVEVIKPLIGNRNP